MMMLIVVSLLSWFLGKRSRRQLNVLGLCKYIRYARPELNSTMPKRLDGMR